MNKSKFLILGAGPAGLSFANELLIAGEDDFIIIEKEKMAGGLCRSVDIDEAPFDIGGGHFLDVRHPQVNKFLFQFMPKEEWNCYKRNSKIVINDDVVDHPIEANIWQMKIEEQVEYLKSISRAGCNLGTPMPTDFIDWIYWKLGNKVAEEYMVPYNQKMFGNELDHLGTYWLEKLPSVSFEETLFSCLTKKAYGEQSGHAEFYYPKKYGYGELWLRMAENLGDNIQYNNVAKNIDFDSKTVITDMGKKYQADVIVTTIPWMEFEEIISMPEEIIRLINELKYTSIQTEYHPEELDTKAHWIYYPNPDLSYHRILARHNFCLNSRGYWTETNGTRIRMEEETNNFKYMNQYAYPLNTINKPEIMKRLLGWCKEHDVYGLGRWGEHQHYNSDLTVELAIKLADSFTR